MTEYVISVIVEELDENGDIQSDFVLSRQWEGGTKLIHGLTEAERIITVLSVAKVPGA